MIPRSGNYYLIEYGSDLELWINGTRGWHNCHDFRNSDLPLVPEQIQIAEAVLQENAEPKKISMTPIGGTELTLCWKPGGRTDGVVECYCDRELFSSSLLLCGVSRQQERSALGKFNRFVRADRRLRYSEETPPIYALKERPICVSVYHADKNDRHHLHAMLVVKAFAAAYFRKWFVA